jgi:hypothetical protein
MIEMNPAFLNFNIFKILNKMVRNFCSLFKKMYCTWIQRYKNNRWYKNNYLKLQQYIQVMS